MFVQPLLENLLEYADYKSTLAFVSTCKAQQQSRNWLIANCTVVDHQSPLIDLCHCVLAKVDTIKQVLLLSFKVTRLTFSDEFDQSLVKVALPSSLTHLTFGWKFNQPLDNVTLPASLTHLEFGAHFNRSLDKVALPSKLTHLTLGNNFNQPLDNITLPANCIVKIND